MKTETITIVLPLPPQCLSPNRTHATRGGRFKTAAASKKCRKQARKASIEQQIADTPWAFASVRATFYHKQIRRRDDVNHLAMLKPAYDGIVDAGILLDDDANHLQTLPPRFKIDKKTSRVELTLKKERPCSVCGERIASCMGGTCYSCDDLMGGRG